MSNLAVVCQAYGTDPTGQLPSQMDIDVVKAAIKLVAETKAGTVIFQGGFTFEGGPTEAELMASAYRKASPRVNPHTIEETKSLNTLQGARAILTIAQRNGMTDLIVIGQRFHIRRIFTTYRGVFEGSGIDFQAYSVRTPFGPNSQSRLRSAWNWWPWEILARIATPILIFLDK